MTAAGTTNSTGSGSGAGWLAGLLFLYVWVTLTPFRDLSQETSLITADLQSNLLNQVVALALFASTMIIVLRRDLRPLVMRPFTLIALVIAWAAFTTAIGPAGVLGVRRLAMATILIGMASAFLLLPRNERQLADILAICASIVLALCYFGVIFMPQLAVHQATDFLEPALAGDWRGLFGHKNDAAPSMVVLAFVGLYLMQARSRAVGFIIFALAAFFVFKSGGKTAMALLPVGLVLAWLVERGNMLWRAIVVFGAVAGYTTLTVGSVLVPSLSKFIDGLGIDSTFTGRTDIWELAIAGIQARPFLGYGYGGYWGTEQVVYAFHEDTTWAVIAPTAHNGYVDIILLGGVFALALVLLWIVVLPLRDLSRAIARNGATPLTRLYVRIWVFALVMGGMESIYLNTTGTVWFAMLIAIFGLRHEARAYRRVEATQPLRPVPDALAHGMPQSGPRLSPG